MTKIARIAGIVLAGLSLLLVVLIAAAAVTLRFVNFNQYKPLIAEEVRKATGRDLVILGDVKLAILFSPGIAVEGVTLSNADWGSRANMVSAERLEAHVALIPLVFGELEIASIELTGADILLESDSGGRANFDFTPPEAGREGGRQPGAAGSGIGAIPVIQWVKIGDSRLTYISGATGATYKIDIDLLTLAAGGWGEPIDAHYAGSFRDTPIKVRAQLGAVVDLLKPRKPWPVELTLEAGGATVIINGTIAEPLASEGIDLAIEARGKQLADVSGLAGREIPALGGYSFSTRVVGDATAVLALPDLKANLGESDLAGEATVTLSGDPAVAEARLNAGKIDLAALGTGLKAPLVNASAAISLRGGKLDIESFNATLSGAAVTAKGSIDASARGKGLNLVVSAQGGQLGDLSQLTGAKVPALGAYSMSARVTGDVRSKIDLAGLRVQIGAGTVTGEATVTPRAGGTVFAAKLASEQIDLAALGVGVNARLQDTTTQLSLRGRKLDIGLLSTTLAGAAVTVSGTIADVARLGGLDLAVTARGERLADLAERLGGKARPPGGYSATARVTGGLAAVISISDLAARLGSSDISGNAQLMLAGKTPAFNARLASDTIDLPALGVGHAPLRGTVATLSLKDGKLQIESVEANLSGAAVLVKGTIAEPAKPAGLDLTITAEGKQLGDLTGLVGRDMPALGSYAASTRLTGDATETMQLSNLTARAGESNLVGNVKVTLSGERPFIEAGLTSNRIDLAFPGSATAKGDAAGEKDVAGQNEAAKKPDRIFPGDPLSLGWLKAVDARLRFDAATVTGGGPLRRNAAVVVSLRNGLLDIESFKADTSNGVLEGAVQIDGRMETARLAARVELRKVDLAVMLANTSRAGAVEGQVNFDVDVTGKGNSIRDIMASLDGTASLAMGKGRIRSGRLQRWVGGPTQVLSNVLTLNVGGYTKINCALGVVGIEKGVMKTDGLLLDTDVAAFVAKGTVNLKTEALDMTINTQVKKITLSAAVPVHVRGTLANPKYKADEAAVVRRVGGLLGSLVYPPALILGLGELGTLKAGDCAVRTDSAKDQTSRDPTEQQPRTLPGRLLKGTGDTITRGFEGLFGR